MGRHLARRRCGETVNQQESMSSPCRAWALVLPQALLQPLALPPSITAVYGKGSTGGTEMYRGVASLAAASHGLLTPGTQAGEADTWLTQQGGGLM